MQHHTDINRHRFPADTHTVTVCDWLITITRFAPEADSAPGVDSYDVAWTHTGNGAVAVGAVDCASLAHVKMYALREAMRLDDEVFYRRARSRDGRRAKRKGR